YFYLLEIKGFFYWQTLNEEELKMKKRMQTFIFLWMAFGVILTKTETTQAANRVDDEANPDGAKTFVIGLDDTFAPMGFRNEQGELVGFDIDLSKEVAERLDMHFIYQSIDWSVKEQELNSGNIDMIWNGYGITPEREELVQMTDPYIEDTQIIVTRARSEEHTSELQSRFDLVC